MKRVDELNSPLNTATELEKYLNKVKELERDLYMELSFAAEVLQQNLSTLPASDGRGGIMGTVSSKVRAKRVANNLRRAAEASKYSGAQAVKTWREFVKAFAPEIDARRHPNRQKKSGFTVDK